jgi:ferredoxin-NADP reductase
MVVRLPCRDAQIGRRHVPERRATIAALNAAGSGWTSLIVRLVAEGEYGQAAEFLPGQFMEMHIPGTDVWQAAAMANLPNDEGLLEFLFPPAPCQALAAWLAQAGRGAAVQLRGPLGRFGLDATSPRPRCLIGAGAGLAPLLAMLRQLAAQRDRTRVHFIVEADHAGQEFVAHRLAPLHAALPQLSVTNAAADAPAALNTQLEKLPESDIYACGPAPLLTAVADAARAHGVLEGRIRAEPAPKFGDDPAANLTQM